MDPNAANPQQITNTNPVVSPQPTITTQPQQSQGGGRKWVKVLIILVVLILLGVGGYFGYKYYFAQKQTYNAGVYKEPQTVVKVTPTPSGYQPNPNDSSNQAIDSDTSQINKDINAGSTDLTNIDQSVSDQQTNLQ